MDEPRREHLLWLLRRNVSENLRLARAEGDPVKAAWFAGQAKAYQRVRLRLRTLEAV